MAALPVASFPVHVPAARALLALHAPITVQEVLTGLRKLRNGRATGVHGLPAELLRYARAGAVPGSPAPVNVLAPVLAGVLDAAFTSATVPAAFNAGLVTPVYKKGSKVDVLNYRPIAVTEPIMRLYAGVLNACIVAFTEGYDLRADMQAGFRPGRSTVHQLFTLQHFIDKERRHKRVLCACFLDLKSAYDRVNRALLWEVLRRLGIGGRMLAAVQSLYAGCTVAMKIGDRVGRSLPSVTGLKQGCPLSPTLFGLFSDGLHRHLQLLCPTVGPQLGCGTRVRDLGYVDDFALLATTPAGLQCLIDAAASFCEQTGMQISADKTNIVVFSTCLPGPCAWRCNGVSLAWVQQAQYLGAVCMGVAPPEYWGEPLG